ncbi:MAG: RNA methyltransferase [Clostridia bacterium]|nr:RNA methyltransferase [Clostridia bacterium]
MLKPTKNFILNLKKQKRENKSLLFLDNVKIIKDALANKTIKPECILTSLDSLPFEFEGEVYKVESSIIEQLSDTKTPQKVLCIACLSQYVVEQPKTNFLVLDSLQDPGNIGTLIRTAKACGFEYVFMLDCVRKQNSKLIRSSVGAVFDSKVYEMSRQEFIDFVNKHNLSLVCCDMNGKNIFELKFDKKIGVVIGNEGQGVSEEIARLCYKTVKIPMKSGIESLNAGVSGSIIMYQINKDLF